MPFSLKSHPVKIYNQTRC